MAGYQAPLGRRRAATWIWLAWRGRWVWEPGFWERVRPGHRWVEGHWAAHRHGWVWIEGHWAR